MPIIFKNTKAINESDIGKLLSDTRDSVLRELRSYKTPINLSGDDFEDFVFKVATDCAKGTKLANRLEQTLARDFPDIIAAGHYGIEVKLTKSNKWTSIGNSVLESSRVKSVKKVFMFFGKLGGTPDIKYRKYEECLKGISVTHYPRYQIDMDLKDGESIFDKMGVSYDKIKDSDNPIKYIRKHYSNQKKPGDSLWWIDNNADKEFDPIIKNMSSLSVKERNNIIADVFVNFPEIFSNSGTKYREVPAFIVSKYGAVTHSLRDYFSSGGRTDVKIDGKIIKAARIIKNMTEVAPIIKTLLKNEQEWINDIDKYSAELGLSEYKLSDFYKAYK